LAKVACKGCFHGQTEEIQGDHVHDQVHVITVNEPEVMKR
jgi:hypothetical protein